MTPKSINVAVADQVAKLGSEKVVNTVVEKLVNAEVAKRAEALAAAIKLAEDTLREQRKADKPDQIAVTTDGQFYTIKHTYSTAAVLSTDLQTLVYTMPILQSAASVSTLFVPGLLVHYLIPAN